MGFAPPLILLKPGNTYPGAGTLVAGTDAGFNVL